MTKLSQRNLAYLGCWDADHNYHWNGSIGDLMEVHPLIAMYFKRCLDRGHRKYYIPIFDGYLNIMNIPNSQRTILKCLSFQEFKNIQISIDSVSHQEVSLFYSPWRGFQVGSVSLDLDLYLE